MMRTLVAVIVSLLILAGQSQKLTVQDSFFAGLPDENYIILIISRLGLANRLRALADWHQLGGAYFYHSHYSKAFYT